MLCLVEKEEGLLVPSAGGREKKKETGPLNLHSRGEKKKISKFLSGEIEDQGT